MLYALIGALLCALATAVLGALLYALPTVLLSAMLWALPCSLHCSLHVADGCRAETYAIDGFLGVSCIHVR